jgi:hypothetical protein
MLLPNKLIETTRAHPHRQGRVSVNRINRLTG